MLDHPTTPLLEDLRGRFQGDLRAALQRQGADRQSGFGNSSWIEKSQQRIDSGGWRVSKNRELAIAVYNTGKGIPAVELPTLSVEYRQAEESENAAQIRDG